LCFSFCTSFCISFKSRTWSYANSPHFQYQPQCQSIHTKQSF
jgi:hypothetical protein